MPKSEAILWYNMTLDTWGRCTGLLSALDRAGREPGFAIVLIQDNENYYWKRPNSISRKRGPFITWSDTLDNAKKEFLYINPRRRAAIEHTLRKRDDKKCLT